MHVRNSPAAAPAASQDLAPALLRNVTSGWAALLVNAIISFVLAPVVVNTLGSVYYGIWALVNQFTGYLWLFDFGVRESVIKYVSQYHAAGEDEKLETTVRTAISVYTMVTLVALIAVAGITTALPYLFNIPEGVVQTARAAAFITGATVAQAFLSNVFVGVLMGLQRIYLVARMSIVFSLIRAAAIYGVLLAGHGLVALATINLILSLANAGLVFYYCRVFLPHVRFRPIRPVREEVMTLFNYGKYVLLSNIGDKVVFATDAIVIGMFLPIAALTPYAIAGTLITQMRSVVMAMAAVFNPLTSSLRATHDERVVQGVLQSGAKAAMAVGLPLCLGFIMLGERFVALWMGDAHAATAGRIMTVLSLGYIIGLPYYTISGVLYGLGQHRIIAILRVVEGAINLTLSVVLVNVVGLVGVAIGMAVPHAVIVGWVLPRALPRIFPVSLRAYYLNVYGRTLLAAVPFALATWAIRTIVQPATLPGFFAWGGLSLVAYAVPVWLIVLSSGERAHLARVVGRLTPRSVLASS
jgi:O-antigen/teichoic acid export membrane protein